MKHLIEDLTTLAICIGAASLIVMMLGALS